MAGLWDVPAHLRELIVQQDYARYTEEDQAVWRFALSQSRERLLRTAHPGYARGFDAAGIRTSEIPRIDHIGEQLSRFGFGAVCVDGFIPPRAFAALLARGVLPIAAGIRSAQHLAYTPAPDIIHEAGGHAPFLFDPEFASFVRRIGEVAEKSFSKPSDRAVYDAIYMLSEVKEDPSSSPARIALAQADLERATGALAEPSEAAKVARLYWWTVEYGLVGSLDDYRLVGAGLLSSLGEGHFCHEPRVRKLPLTAACIDIDYDITQAQPQLFVARDFAALHEVLDAVASTLSQRTGGETSLLAAQHSAEVATLELDSGLQLCGQVQALHRVAGVTQWLQLQGPCALARHGEVLPALPRSDGYALATGCLRDGPPLSQLDGGALRARTRPDGRFELSLRSGLSLRGQLRDVLAPQGRVQAVVCTDFELAEAQRVLFRQRSPYALALCQQVLRAHAGVAAGFHADTALSPTTVPRARASPTEHRRILRLHEAVSRALRTRTGPALVHTLARIAARLDRDHPHEWLLRHRLLDALLSKGSCDATARTLRTQLEGLELHFSHEQPIATGLAQLAQRFSSSDDDCHGHHDRGNHGEQARRHSTAPPESS